MTLATRTQFAEYIQKNVKLYGITNNIELSPAAVANFVRAELAKALRSAPKSVNVLIAGYDDTTGPELYWIDYLGSLAKVTCQASLFFFFFLLPVLIPCCLVQVPYAVQGYAAYFTLSTMDRFFQNDMTLEEAKDLLGKCIHELQSRFVMNQSTFLVKVVSKEGTQQITL